MALPTQVSPPQIALSDVAPSAVVGADVVAVPVLAGPRRARRSAPAPPSSLDELGDDLFGAARARRGHRRGRRGRASASVLDTAGLTNPDLRLVLLVGVGERHARRPAPGRRRPGPAHRGPALGRHLAGRARRRRRPARPRRGRWCSAPSSSTGAPTARRRQPVGRVVLAGLVDARRPQGRAWRRALAVAGAGWRARTLALVPSNVKNPAWLAEQAAEVAEPGRAEGPGLGREAARRARASAASSASARAPRTRRGWSGWTTARARRPQGAARRAGRQGHHLRHRRPLDQARATA